MDAEELKEMIKFIKDANPYPIDVFREPTDDEWHEVGKFLADNGRSPERIFGKFGRMVWNNCIEMIESCYTEDLKNISFFLLPKYFFINSFSSIVICLVVKLIESQVSYTAHSILIETQVFSLL